MTTFAELLEQHSTESLSQISTQSWRDSFAHFGVRGMKWGIRKDHVGPSRTKDGASPDHLNVANIKSTAKSSGVQVLSNKQLQEAITRMNLENQFNNLSTGKKNKGSTWAKKFLINVGQQQAQNAANQIAAKQVAKLLAKMAIG